MCKGTGTKPTETRDTKQIDNEKKDEIRQENESKENEIKDQAEITGKEMAIIDGSNKTEENGTGTSNNTGEPQSVGTETNSSDSKDGPKATPKEDTASFASRIGSFFSGLYDKAINAINNRQNAVQIEKHAEQLKTIAEKYKVEFPAERMSEITHPNPEIRQENIRLLEIQIIDVQRDRYLDRATHGETLFTFDQVKHNEGITYRINEIIGRATDFHGGTTPSHFLGTPAVLDRLNANNSSDTFPTRLEWGVRTEMENYTEKDAVEMKSLIENIEIAYNILEAASAEISPAIVEDIEDQMVRSFLYNDTEERKSYAEIIDELRSSIELGIETTKEHKARHES